MGHIALGYLLGKASARLLNLKMIIPIVITLSIIPDIDLLMPVFRHGGPTHSIILLLAIAFPAILIWEKQTIPYLLAIVSHSLLGDFLTRWSPWRGPVGVQLVFPLSNTWFSAGFADAQFIYVYLEIFLFTVFLAVLLITKDLKIMMGHHTSNLLLLVPILAVFLPLFTQFGVNVPSAPAELFIPQLVLIALLTLPILIDIQYVLRHLHRPQKHGAHSTITLKP